MLVGRMAVCWGPPACASLNLSGMGLAFYLTLPMWGARNAGAQALWFVLGCHFSLSSQLPSSPPHTHPGRLPLERAPCGQPYHHDSTPGMLAVRVVACDATCSAKLLPERVGRTGPNPCPPGSPAVEMVVGLSGDRALPASLQSVPTRCPLTDARPPVEKDRNARCRPAQ